MRHGEQRSAAELESEIARTRTDMEATLRAIESRLAPGELVEQGLHYLKNSGAKEFVSNLTASVKHNPLPVVITGLGMAWLALASRRPAAAYKGGAYETGTGSGSSGLRERAGDALDRASETAAAARDSVARAGDTLTEKAGQMRARARRAVESGRRQADRARQGYQYMLREQPLALGAIGLAVGAAIAAAVPRTRQEDAWMGEARDRLADEARAAGKEQLEKAGEMARAATQAMAQGGSSESASREPEISAGKPL